MCVCVAFAALRGIEMGKYGRQTLGWFLNCVYIFFGSTLLCDQNFNHTFKV